MKRLFIFSLFTLISFGAWAGTASESDALRFSLVITQGSKLITSSEFSAAPGTSVPFQVSTQHTYIQRACQQAITGSHRVYSGGPSEAEVAEDCSDEGGARTSIHGATQTTLVPGTFTTGLAVTLDTEKQSDRVRVRVVLTQLVKVNTFKQDDLTIELPEITQHVLDKNMTLKAHQTVNLLENEHNGRNGLKMTLTRL